jgi:hypothetical protein
VSKSVWLEFLGLSEEEYLEDLKKTFREGLREEGLAFIVGFGPEMREIANLVLEETEFKKLKKLISLL